jgi:homoserine kinase
MSARGTADGVRVFAPATVANLGPGFDVLGLAVAGPGDVVTARRSATRGIRLVAVRGAEGLPTDAATNTAGIAAKAVLARSGLDAGIDLELDKGLPSGSGLGSSATSAAAAALAVNLVLGSPLRKAELLEPCLEAEAAVSGRHGDNVAPALLGGIVLVRSLDPPDLIRLPAFPGLHVAVVTPDLHLATREARAALPDRVPLADLVATTANLAGLVTALHSGDAALLSRSMHDPVVTPARIGLIPGAADALDAARDAGALGASISGAGPSLFALCRSERSAAGAAEAMERAFAAAGHDATRIVSPAEAPGARKL